MIFHVAKNHSAEVEFSATAAPLPVTTPVFKLKSDLPDDVDNDRTEVEVSLPLVFSSTLDSETVNVYNLKPKVILY